MIYTDSFRHAPDMWWLWVASMVVLVGAVGAARIRRGRGPALVALGVVSLVMVWFVGDSVASTWRGVGATLSASLYVSGTAGLFFGVPVVLACFGIVLPEALEAWDVSIERPGAHVVAVIAGALSVALALVGLGADPPTALLTGGVALSGLLWMVHVATVAEPRHALLVPIAVVAVWCAVTGAATHAVLDGMAGGGGVVVRGVPWALRAVVFGAALAYALLVERRWGTLALPVVVAMLWAGSPINVLKALNTPVAEGADWRDASHW